MPQGIPYVTPLLLLPRPLLVSSYLCANETLAGKSTAPLYLPFFFIHRPQPFLFLLYAYLL